MMKVIAYCLDSEIPQSVRMPRWPSMMLFAIGPARRSTRGGRPLRPSVRPQRRKRRCSWASVRKTLVTLQQSKAAGAQHLCYPKAAFCSSAGTGTSRACESGWHRIALLAAAAQASKPITRRRCDGTGRTSTASKSNIHRTKRKPTVHRARAPITNVETHNDATHWRARGAAKDAPDAGDRTGTCGWPGGDCWPTTSPCIRK